MREAYPNSDGVGDKGTGRQAIGNLGGRGDIEDRVGLVEKGADAATCGAWGGTRDGGECGVWLWLSWGWCAGAEGVVVVSALIRVRERHVWR